MLRPQAALRKKEKGKEKKERELNSCRGGLLMNQTKHRIDPRSFVTGSLMRDVYDVLGHILPVVIERDGDQCKERIVHFSPF